MFYLLNLSSQGLRTGIAPWDFQPHDPIPEEVRKNKKKRDEWINRPSTKHHVYTFFEGVNPNVRISKLRTDGGGNPVHAIHALVADYDSPQPEETVMRLANELPYVPNKIEKTLSGNWRFVWLLESKLILPSTEFAKHFLQTFAEFAFDPKRGMMAFDEGAWEAPERLYTNSCEWRHLHDEVIPATLAQGWLVKASEKFRFTDGSFGTAIPLETIAPELTKRYPKFQEWPGEFTLGAQGPTFWVNESLSPKSAIVRETGIQTFSHHAAKGFYSWADLLGVAFVKEFEADASGRAVEGIYHDGRQYWRKIPNGRWCGFEKGDIISHLRTGRGVSSKVDGNRVSAIDKAVEHIQNHNRVDAAAPYVYRATGLIHINNRRVLNISQTRVMPPAEEPGIWGPGGNFPWVSQLHDLFNDEQRDISRAWLAWAYQHAYRLEPTSGHVLFIVGPACTGKTLLNRAVFGGLLGGFAEANSFLTNADAFNSEMFEYGLWCIDDGSVSTTPAKHRLWSEMLKRVAANGEFRVNEKFRKAAMAEWKGRVCVTMNGDEQSTQMLPATGMSNLEKLIMLRTEEKAPCVFPSQAEIKRILDRELPFFARWLLDWKIPAHLMGDSRFGIKSYADPSLVETTRQSSSVAGFNEILEDWKEQYFTVRERKADRWEGTAFQLQKQILLDPTAESAMRRFDVDAVNRHLVALRQQNSQIETFSQGGRRIWRIYRAGAKTGSPSGK